MDNVAFFVPLNKPISLARGSIKSEPFQINLKGYYFVEVATRRLLESKLSAVQQYKSTLVRNRSGELVAKSEVPANLDYGGFQAENGSYQIRLDILSDAACMNPARPRLLIYTDRSEYGGRTFVVFSHQLNNSVVYPD